MKIKKQVFSTMAIGLDTDQVRDLAGKPDEITITDSGACWLYRRGEVIIFFNNDKRPLVNKIIIKNQKSEREEKK